MNGQVITTENITDRHPLTFYDVVYELPAITNNKATITFRAAKGFHAGAVYGLKITGDPKAFPGYLFY